MHLGIGVDLIEIERIARAIERHGELFLSRHFTKREREYCQTFQNQSERFAGRFAAKEAIVKAFGTGISEEISWLDIEILPDERGSPRVSLSERSREHFAFSHCHLSISHCKTVAIAFAMIE